MVSTRRAIRTEYIIRAPLGNRCSLPASFPDCCVNKLVKTTMTSDPNVLFGSTADYSREWNADRPCRSQLWQPLVALTWPASSVHVSAAKMTQITGRTRFLGCLLCNLIPDNRSKLVVTRQIASYRSRERSSGASTRGVCTGC